MLYMPLNTFLFFKASKFYKSVMQGTIFSIFRKPALPYSGPYARWEDALSHSTGWDSPIVLDMVSVATENLLKGSYEYERDGVNFAKKPPVDPLKSCLKDLAGEVENIIDFGGGLGGTFFNNLDIYKNREVNWIVIEQENFVKAGNLLADKYSVDVDFINAFEEVSVRKIDLVIFSGVLHYIENWASILNEAISRDAKYILVDRTPFHELGNQIFVQENPGYYQTKVSYPCWLLNLDQFMSSIQGYSLVRTWISPFDADNHKGFLLRKN